MSKRKKENQNSFENHSVQHNEVLLLKTDKFNSCRIFLNGSEVKNVTDFKYEKNSARDCTEFMLKFEVDKLEEYRLE